MTGNISKELSGYLCQNITGYKTGQPFDMTTLMPLAPKPQKLCVATAMPREQAIAAIWQSAGAKAQSAARCAAVMLAYARAAS